MRKVVTQSLKWYLRGCLPREDVYAFLDSLWMPYRLGKIKFRNRKVNKFVDLLHRDRISLNRIININVDYEYPTLYIVQIYYLSRRGKEYYAAYSPHR